MASEREIFERALAILDAQQRAEYLQQACGRDAALREHIEGLLEVHARIGDFLESPPLADPDFTIERRIAEGPGTANRPLQAPRKLAPTCFQILETAIAST